MSNVHIVENAKIANIAQDVEPAKIVLFVYIAMGAEVARNARNASIAIIKKAKKTGAVIIPLSLEKQIMFEIQKGFPIPKQNNFVKYPFKIMEVGDSFFVEVEGKPTKEKANSVRASASYYRRKYGYEYMVRKVGNGFRVWRTK